MKGEMRFYIYTNGTVRLKKPNVSLYFFICVLNFYDLVTQLTLNNSILYTPFKDKIICVSNWG